MRNFQLLMLILLSAFVVSCSTAPTKQQTQSTEYKRLEGLIKSHNNFQHGTTLGYLSKDGSSFANLLKDGQMVIGHIEFQKHEVDFVLFSNEREIIATGKANAENQDQLMDSMVVSISTGKGLPDDEITAILKNIQ